MDNPPHPKTKSESILRRQTFSKDAPADREKGKIYIDIYRMKVSGRIVSIMMAAVVVLFAFLLLSTVGGNQRDGFKEGETPNNKPLVKASTTGGKTNPAAAATRQIQTQIKADAKKTLTGAQAMVSTKPPPPQPPKPSGDNNTGGSTTPSKPKM